MRINLNSGTPEFQAVATSASQAIKVAVRELKSVLPEARVKADREIQDEYEVSFEATEGMAELVTTTLAKKLGFKKTANVNKAYYKACWTDETGKVLIALDLRSMGSGRPVFEVGRMPARAGNASAAKKDTGVKPDTASWYKSLTKEQRKVFDEYHPTSRLHPKAEANKTARAEEKEQNAKGREERAFAALKKKHPGIRKGEEYHQYIKRTTGRLIK